MREIEGLAGFPLYKVTGTRHGVARVRWLNEHTLEVGVAGGTKFDTHFTTTLLDLGTGNTWSLGDESSFCWLPGQVAYSPDGSQLAYATAEGLLMASLDGSSRRLLAPAGGERPGIDYQQLTFSPDGGRLAFHDCTAGGYGLCEALRVLDLQTGEDIYAYSGEGFMGRATWSPDGRYLAFYTAFTETHWQAETPGRLTTIVAEVGRGKETSLPPIPSFTDEFGICIAPQWLGESGKVFLQTYHGGVWIGSPATGQVEQLPGSIESLYPAPVSPNKEWIAYEGARVSYLYNLAGRNTQRDHCAAG